MIITGEQRLVLPVIILFQIILNVFRVIFFVIMPGIQGLWSKYLAQQNVEREADSEDQHPLNTDMTSAVKLGEVDWGGVCVGAYKGL